MIKLLKPLKNWLISSKPTLSISQVLTSSEVKLRDNPSNGVLATGKNSGERILSNSMIKRTSIWLVTSFRLLSLMLLELQTWLKLLLVLILANLQDTIPKVRNTWTKRTVAQRWQKSCRATRLPLNSKKKLSCVTSVFWWRITYKLRIKL